MEVFVKKTIFFMMFVSSCVSNSMDLIHPFKKKTPELRTLTVSTLTQAYGYPIAKVVEEESLKYNGCLTLAQIRHAAIRPSMACLPKEVFKKCLPSWHLFTIVECDNRLRAATPLYPKKPSTLKKWWKTPKLCLDLGDGCYNTGLDFVATDTTAVLELTTVKGVNNSAVVMRNYTTGLTDTFYSEADINTVDYDAKNQVLLVTYQTPKSELKGAKKWQHHVYRPVNLELFDDTGDLQSNDDLWNFFTPRQAVLIKGTEKERDEPGDVNFFS